MERKLGGINRLLKAVYGRETRMQTLLRDYLEPEELEYLKREKLDEFLSLFLLGIRCRYATIANGMRLYARLAGRYGLEWFPAPAAQTDEERREEQRALRHLKPRTHYDPPRLLACLAAREILELERLPRQSDPEQEADDSAFALPTLEELAALVTGAPVSLSVFQKNITDALHTRRGRPGYISARALRGWLIGQGYLEILPNERSGQTTLPTQQGNRLGIYTAEREDQMGRPYQAVLYRESAQRLILEHLPEIAAGLPQGKAATPRHKNQGAPWTDDLDAQLRRRAGEGATIGELSAEMERSPGGIRSRLEKLGLPKPT